MEYTPLIIEGVSLQPLRFPAGWKVSTNVFYDVEPKGEPKVKGYPDDNGWLLFDHELLMIEHERQSIILDMGWKPEYEPDGRFVLILVKDTDWMNSQRLYETRDKAEIIEAINGVMLRIGREGGDYTAEGDGLMLQQLIVTAGWRVTRNQFFDLTPHPKLKVHGLPNEDGWVLFGAHMLQLETSFDAEYKVDLSWEPAHNPAGRYVVRLVRHDDWGKPLEQRETRDKDEVVKLIHQLCVE